MSGIYRLAGLSGQKSRARVSILLTVCLKEKAVIPYPCDTLHAAAPDVETKIPL